MVLAHLNVSHMVHNFQYFMYLILTFLAFHTGLAGVMSQGHRRTESCVGLYVGVYALLW